MRLGAAIQCELSLSDIVHAYRTRPRDNKGALIMVRFGSVGIRTHFFKCYMVEKVIDSSCLGFAPGNKIYISDNLTRQNAYIRTRAVQLKHDGKLAFHTVRDGIVHITLNNEDRRNKHPVRSAEELEYLVSPSTERFRDGRAGSASSAIGAQMGAMHLNKNSHN